MTFERPSVGQVTASGVPRESCRTAPTRIVNCFVVDRVWLENRLVGWMVANPSDALVRHNGPRAVGARGLSA